MKIRILYTNPYLPIHIRRNYLDKKATKQFYISTRKVLLHLTLPPVESTEGIHPLYVFYTCFQPFKSLSFNNVMNALFLESIPYHITMHMYTANLHVFVREF